MLYDAVKRFAVIVCAAFAVLLYAGCSSAPEKIIYQPTIETLASAAVQTQSPAFNASFTESKDMPLPSRQNDIYFGEYFRFAGKITASQPMERVGVEMENLKTGNIVQRYG